MATGSATPSPDIWTIEFARGIATRVTFDAAADTAPVWSPDSTRITFRSNRGNAGNIYETDLAGTTKEKVLVESPEADAPTDWSSDGRFLLFNRFTNTVDLWVLPAKTQPPTPVALLETPFGEQDGRFSPDGRWISYTSNESGEDEIYLRPFAIGSNGAPAVGPKWRVSTTGGASARWRRDGKELFYRDRSGAIVAVDVVVKGSSIETGAPRPLFISSLGTNSFDVHPDGQRFLVSGLLSFQATSPDPVTVVLNWTTARSGQ